MSLVLPRSLESEEALGIGFRINWGKNPVQVGPECELRVASPPG